MINFIIKCLFTFKIHAFFLFFHAVKLLYKLNINMIDVNLKTEAIEHCLFQPYRLTIDIILSMIIP